MSTVGAGVQVTGDIVSLGELQVDGRIKGDVRCASLVVREEGIVEGSVSADDVRVFGAIEGSVSAADCAIERSGRIKGDVLYSRLQVANGGALEGRLERLRTPDPGDAALQPEAGEVEAQSGETDEPAEELEDTAPTEEGVEPGPGAGEQAEDQPA